MSDGSRGRTLCIFCGEDAPQVNILKCPSCGDQPKTMEELAYAMAFSFIVCTDEALDHIAEQLRDGGPRPKMPAKVFDDLLMFAGSIDLDRLFAGTFTKH